MVWLIKPTPLQGNIPLYSISCSRWGRQYIHVVFCCFETETHNNEAALLSSSSSLFSCHYWYCCFLFYILLMWLVFTLLHQIVWIQCTFVVYIKTVCVLHQKTPCDWCSHSMMHCKMGSHIWMSECIERVQSLQYMCFALTNQPTN